MDLNSLEHKKNLMNQMTAGYVTRGPLPPLEELHSFLSQLDPRELARACYTIEASEALVGYTKPFASVVLGNAVSQKVEDSQAVKEDVEKLFMAVVGHFRESPEKASETVDVLFRYLSKSLVHVVTECGLTSMN